MRGMLLMQGSAAEQGGRAVEVQANITATARNELAPIFTNFDRVTEVEENGIRFSPEVIVQVHLS